MGNPWGRLGAPMIQPRKADLLEWLVEARDDATRERRLRRAAEYNLMLAKRKLGELVLEGKIALPVERLGELVLEAALEEEVQSDSFDSPKLIAK